jgi:hypothetical protein
MWGSYSNETDVDAEMRGVQMKKFYLIFFLVILISDLFSVYHKLSGIHTEENISDAVMVDEDIIIIEDYRRIKIYDLSSILEPVLISNLDFDGNAYEIIKYENTCFLKKESSIIIMDISDIQNPFIVNEISFTTDDIKSMCIQSHILYIATDYELQLVFVIDPMNPVLISSYDILMQGNYTRCIDIINNMVVIGSSDGLYIIDVTDLLNPELLTFYETYSIRDVNVENGLLYYGGYYGFVILDISNPVNIQILSSYEEVGISELHVSGNILNTFCGFSYDESFYRFDVSDLLNPILLGDYNEGGNIIAVTNDIAYLFNNDYYHADLTIIDVSDPDNKYFIGSSYYQCGMRDIDASNSIIGVCSSENSGVNYFDISDPTIPEWLFSHSFGYNMEVGASTVYIKEDLGIAGFCGGTLSNSCIRIHDLGDSENIQVLSGMELGDASIRKIAVKENTAYIGCSGEMFIVDISDLTNPCYVDVIDTGFALDIEIRGCLLYLAEISRIRIFDISNPEIPLEVGGWESTNRAEAINVLGDYAYVADYRGGLKILNVSNSSNPYWVNTILPHFDSIIYSKPVIQNSKLIISDVNWNELLVYDLTNPAYPNLIESYKWNRTSYELVSTEDYLITANGSSGYTILDLTDLSTESDLILLPSESLLSIYPNPFNPSTTIRFQLNNDTTENTELVIYNIKGQKVKQLVSDQLAAGKHEVIWNGTDETGKIVSSGIYFCKLKCGEVIQTKRMLMLK